jgi:aminoglycoside phosphotransferase family enzyme/predicted kinase
LGRDKSKDGLNMKPELRAFFESEKNYPHPAGPIQHIETHISDVFLTGEYAYKIKKPLNLGFLDYSTLEKRRLFCERELSLNRRYAKELYEAVIPITQKKSLLFYGGDGEVVEYALKMRQFPEGALFSELLAKGALTEELLTAAVRKIAQFHRTAEKTPERWSPSIVQRVLGENLEITSTAEVLQGEAVQITQIKALFSEQLKVNWQLISDRQRSFVRFLHGDLHLRNICLYKQQPIPFDGIEFNDDLACCDVWADIAFMLMDLHYRGRGDLASLARNIYLEETDDFLGLALCRLYDAYRAIVRANVSCLEFRVVETTEQKDHAKASAQNHLALARKFLQESKPRLIAIGGFSGSGKSTLAKALGQSQGAVIVRSDVVRKHLIGQPLHVKAPHDAYASGKSKEVYRAVRERARLALRAGFSCIVDAVHGTEEEREAIEDLARDCAVPFTGVWCQVKEEVACARVTARVGDASDADVRIVRQQFQTNAEVSGWHPLFTEESVEKSRNVVESLIDWEAT